MPARHHPSSRKRSPCRMLVIRDECGPTLIFVNGGAHRPRRPRGRAQARATASHNTLSLNEMSSAKLIRHRGPRSDDWRRPHPRPDACRKHHRRKQRRHRMDGVSRWLLWPLRDHPPPENDAKRIGISTFRYRSAGWRRRRRCASSRFFPLRSIFIFILTSRVRSFGQVPDEAEIINAGRPSLAVFSRGRGAQHRRKHLFCRQFRTPTFSAIRPARFVLTATPGSAG